MCAVRSAYDVYSFHVIPVMGQIIAGDWKSYQYLVESIRQFPCQVNQICLLLLLLGASFQLYIGKESVMCGALASY